MRAIEMKDRIAAGADRAKPQEKRVPKDVAWALRGVKERNHYVRLHQNYYKGNQRLMIQSERMRTVFGRLFTDFNLNMCKVVVDALVDRLEVDSFSAEKGDKSNADLAWEIWEANRMARRSGQIFLEAARAGDSYLVVWPHPEPGKHPILYPQSAHEMTVEYDPDIPGKINKAAKVWYEDGPVRENKVTKLCHINIYYPDRVERWYAPKPEQGDPKGEDFRHFTPKSLDPESWRTMHPWGQVPVFHFANNADLGEMGVSELEAALKVQDMANYLVFSLLVGVEFAAMPQKYLMNIEKPQDPETGDYVDPLAQGVEHIWTLQSRAGEGMPTGQVGQLPPADLAQITRVMDLADRKMASVTGTPMHYFFNEQGLSSTPASGEAQKIAEFKLDRKVADRQLSWGDVLAKAMALAVRMHKEKNLDEQGGVRNAGTSSNGSGGNGSNGNTGGPVNDSNRASSSGLDTGQTEDSNLIELGTNWADTRPRNETEIWTVAGLKRTAGVSQKQVLREAGYTDQQINRMEKENKEAAEAFGLGGAAPGSPQDQLQRGIKPKSPQEIAEEKNLREGADKAAGNKPKP